MAMFSYKVKTVFINSPITKTSSSCQILTYFYKATIVSWQERELL